MTLPKATIAQHCRGLKKDGSPCTTRPRASGYCIIHDPSLKVERAAWRKRGGHAKSRAARAEKHMPPTLAGVVARLAEAAEQVHKGELDPRKATALASVSTALMKAYEVAELETRLQLLEDKQATRMGNGHYPGGRRA